MKPQKLQEQKLTIWLNDTGRNKLFLDNKKLKNYMRHTLVVLNDFVFSSKRQRNAAPKSVQNIELALTFCGETKIRSLNARYRNKNKVTDVLSFPVFDSLQSEDLTFTPVIELGDVFICKEVAYRQSKEYDVTLEEEVIHQLIHGVLHLLGFDHELSEADAEEMFGHEEKLVKKVYQRIRK